MRPENRQPYRSQIVRHCKSRGAENEYQSFRRHVERQYLAVVEFFTMHFNCRRFAMRFRLRTLLLLSAIAAGCWLGWNVHWIRLRHEFLASHPVALTGRRPNVPNKAPLSLRLLGEDGVQWVQMNVYTDRDWGSEPMDYPEVRQAAARARKLFPEATTLDIEPTLRNVH